MVDVAAATAAIIRGEIVAYPTETFYGLAVDAVDEGALARLCVLKGREAEKAFPLLVSGREMLSSLCSEVSPLAERLMAQHWPGPLTLALPKILAQLAWALQLTASTLSTTIRVARTGPLSR